MNKALQKKLLSYSALATALLAIDKSADGQIVYTRLNPPDTLAHHDVSASYFLDLNNDGINDFEFHVNTVITSSDNHGYNTYVSRFIYAKGLENNKVGADSAKNYNDSICNNKWQTYNSLARYNIKIHNSSSSRTSHRYFKGYFFGDSSKYLPLKLIVDSNIYYGWVRISIDSISDTLLVYSYAYDSIPNECIGAGDTVSKPSSISQLSIYDKTLVWANGKNLTIKLNNKDLIGSTLFIYNLTGQVIYKNNLSKNESTFNLNDFSNEIYFVSISKNGVRKIYKIALL